MTSGTVQVSTSRQDLTALKKLSLHLNYHGDEASALKETGALISGMIKLTELYKTMEVINKLNVTHQSQ